MSHACPITFVKVDENVSRFNSLFVSSLVIAYLISSNVFILYFLFIDFVVKLFIDKKYSPLFLLAKTIKNILKIESKFTDGGAKRLAAYFGLTFVSLLIAVHYVDLTLLTLVIAVVFLSCALLDVIFNYCLGCKIYYIIKKIYPNFMV